MYTCADRSNPDVAVVSSTNAPHFIACFFLVLVTVLKRVVYFCAFRTFRFGLGGSGEDSGELEAGGVERIGGINVFLLRLDF